MNRMVGRGKPGALSWNLFSFLHPLLLFLLSFVGVPLLMLLSVSLGTAVLACPIALLMGCL